MNKPNNGRFYEQIMNELVIPRLGHEPTLQELSLFDMGYWTGCSDSTSEKFRENLAKLKKAVQDLVTTEV